MRERQVERHPAPVADPLGEPQDRRADDEHHRHEAGLADWQIGLGHAYRGAVRDLDVLCGWRVGSGWIRQTLGRERDIPQRGE